MTINNLQFKHLIKELPEIEVNLEWEHEEGQAEIKNHEIVLIGYLVYVDFNISESGTIDSGDYETQPSFESNGIYVSDITTEIFDKKMDEQIELSEEHTTELHNKIKSIIITN